MRVLEVNSSKERCTESGWDAYDVVIESNIDEEFISALRPLGALVYMPMLKKPFFKVESDYFFLKGIVGDNCFRLASHRDYSDKRDYVISFIERLKFDIKESE
ncbi:MAG: hypothetical protein ACK5LL_05455 [Suipraeoptans sp.]